MIRLFVADDLKTEGEVAPTPGQARYLTAVMRLAVGDEVRLFNGRDGEWRARLVEVARRGCRLLALAPMRPQTVGPDLDLIVALVKRPRLETIVEKAAELGARRVSPIVTSRAQPGRLDGRIRLVHLPGQHLHRHAGDFGGDHHFDSVFAGVSASEHGEFGQQEAAAFKLIGAV